MRAQPRRERPCRRKVPLNQQRERASITGAGPPDQLTVADVHTSKCQPGIPRLPASQVARRRTSQTLTAMSSTDRASSQPPSIHWKGQNRLPG